MSTESIVDARTLRQFLAREATEKETSRQSPEQKSSGRKSKTLHRAQKNMHKERRGNSQSNDYKNYQNNKNQKYRIKITKTTWKAKQNEAKRRSREGGKKREKKAPSSKDVKIKGMTINASYDRSLSFSEMEFAEGKAEKAEYRCEEGGCTAKYVNFIWYKKHLKTTHGKELDRSAWEASVNASSLNISDNTDIIPNEVTVTQQSFVSGIGPTSSQNPEGVRPEAAAAAPNPGKIEKTVPQKRKTTEASSGPMVQIEEKRVRNESEELLKDSLELSSKDSLELSSKDSLELSTCDHTTIQATPEDESPVAVQEVQEAQLNSPSQSQQRRDNLIAQLDNSSNSESLLGGGMGLNFNQEQEVVEEEHLRTGDKSDIFNTTTDAFMGLNPSDLIIKDLEQKLAIKEKSLADALSLNEVFKTDKARLTRELEFANLKREDAEKDNKHKKSEMSKLENALKKAVEKEKAKKGNNDVAILQQKLKDVTAERDRLRGQAESNATLSEIMERNLDEANVKMDKMKKDTICKEKSCESEKICGRSHILKKMKLSQCKFYNIGQCQNTAEDCNYAHDAEAKLKFYQEKEIEKKSFQEIRKEERKRIGQDRKEENKSNESAKLPAKKLSKVEKRKQKKLRQKTAKKEEEEKEKKKKNKNNKNKKKRKDEEEDSDDDDSESEMDVTEKVDDKPPGVQTPGPAAQKAEVGSLSNTNNLSITNPQGVQTPGPTAQVAQVGSLSLTNHQGFQAAGPAVQGTAAGPLSNPNPQGTMNSADTSMESLASMTNFPSMMTNINPSMISMAQLAGIQNLSSMQQIQSPTTQHQQQDMTTMQPHNSSSFNPNFQSTLSLAAIQAQQMTQWQHREMLRRELTKVQNQIHLTQVQAPGSGTLVELAQAEANLRQKMFLSGMMPQ